MLTNFSKMVWKNWELQRSSSFLGWPSEIRFGGHPPWEKGVGQL
jgi:hypothetical protein